MRVRAYAVAAIVACVLGADVRAQLRGRVYASAFNIPVAFVQDPTDRDVQFVVQQDGRIRVVRAGAVLPTDFLTLTSSIVYGGEQGLLGLAFPPDTATSRRVFVNFTDRGGNTVVARFVRAADPVVGDAGSRFDLRWFGVSGPAFIPQPFSNHNGGNLIFGPDGYLYIGMGDGGSANDPANRAQTGTELLGKMLRIDVAVPDSDPIGYRVPTDNPFVDTASRPEIWAFGLRNPWRFSFDDPERGGSGAMIIGDVGQNAWEEVDYQPPGRGGRNYGWRIREGAHNNVTSSPPAFLPLVEPIHEYSHAVGASITGGIVYRGSALPDRYRGRYFFADFFGRIWSLALAVNPSTGEATASDVVEHTSELGGPSAVGAVSSFGVDADGELYFVNYSAGRIVRVVSATPPQPSGLRIIR